MMHLFYDICLRLLFSLLCIVLLCSCTSDEDDEASPSIITEMAVLYVGSSISDTHLLTDSGKDLKVSIEGDDIKPYSRLRCICSYSIHDGSIEIKVLQGVLVLPNYSNKAILYHDPVGVVSAWVGGGFVNMHLLKKTQGKGHDWGFILDNSYVNNAGGTTYEVSLYHDQSGDFAAYSSDIYFSLDIDSLSASPTKADSIVLSMVTFETSPHEWRLSLFQK